MPGDTGPSGAETNAEVECHGESAGLTSRLQAEIQREALRAVRQQQNLVEIFIGFPVCCAARPSSIHRGPASSWRKCEDSPETRKYAIIQRQTWGLD